MSTLTFPCNGHEFGTDATMKQGSGFGPLPRNTFPRESFPGIVADADAANADAETEKNRVSLLPRKSRIPKKWVKVTKKCVFRANLLNRSVSNGQLK